MSDLKKSGVFAAAMFALVIPNIAWAESLLEPSHLGDSSDGADIFVQLDEDGSEGVSDEGNEDDASDEDSTDGSDENTDVAEDGDTGVVDTDAGDENDVAEVEDNWISATGGGDGPIIVEFASGGGPVQRENEPVFAAPVARNSAPLLVAADGFDATLGINVHDKVAVAAQCATLLDSGQTYQAFYKLYCD